MERTKFAVAFVLAAAAITLLIYRLLPGPGGGTPVYDWECAQCQTRFRQEVKNAAADVPAIDCPKCKTKSAERVMHYQCRKCWKKYDRRGSQATLAQVICPACGSRAARDLDNPIPGDDEPVEGGQPNPGP